MGKPDYCEGWYGSLIFVQDRVRPPYQVNIVIWRSLRVIEYKYDGLEEGDFSMEDTVLFLDEKKNEVFFAKYFESLLHNSSSVAK